jgi:hypothetical protein
MKIKLKKSNHLIELNAREPLGVFISQGSKELRLYNVV